MPTSGKSKKQMDAAQQRYLKHPAPALQHVCPVEQKAEHHPEQGAEQQEYRQVMQRRLCIG